jgi:hypothetical protein
LRASLRFLLLSVEPLQFLLALLKRHCHMVSSNTASMQNNLPTRFARLPSRLAVIFIRKSARASPARFRTAALKGLCARCRFRPRFIDFQVPASKFPSIQGSNRFGRLVIVRHFDEGKSTGAAGFSIRDYMYTRDLSEAAEQLPQIILAGLETHVSYKKILHVFSGFSRRGVNAFGNYVGRATTIVSQSGGLAKQLVGSGRF